MTELRGLPAARAITARCKTEIETLRARGVVPTLAILRVGERGDDLSYERGAVKRFASAGAETRVIALPETCTQDELDAAVRGINEDDGIHAALIFRPLPKHLSEERVKTLLDPEKDADCMTPASAAALFMGRAVLPPCTPQAVIELLDHYNIPLSGAKVTLIGRSLVVGKPLALLLIARNATVTVCHTKTRELPAEARAADILIAAAGSAKMVTAEFTRPGQVVVDVGINVVDGALCGDVDFDAVSAVADAVSPVPGGVGSITTAVLLENTVKAAQKRL
ncbi:MAG: bifunctional 5,10-methylenetetrahydrofolate dehydrogenase/5,10-methenyltetrahydrofolate cyclohydrolase [Clostridiaceae bacterium]|nr:bifunctional 5,10-methylenetetrahydrofolate dehydrogenase/5,10-methenyltetrahydrofolate cyclohydrolase [Clostridiales bacterium]MDD6876226.1 bifunctional 5,10-methylenetetrahydrofolate dehydrogenase/5,10-methenyltetrahydrofolate cyclohydrolase [Clostridiaceae bacterium]MDY3285726.1 bifunctional 5,10-methylenetetrahydrofolate dehydrogenase/5,10-methenyltetrahydrofolate cyclohydrolase [Eubacteriales bacterium]MDY5016539.1 bifunctional 5,10-methylenetetrahydrofolate dehydrogenase/5,10-methenylte